MWNFEGNLDRIGCGSSGPVMTKLNETQIIS